MMEKKYAKTWFFMVFNQYGRHGGYFNLIEDYGY